MLQQASQSAQIAVHKPLNPSAKLSPSGNSFQSTAAQAPINNRPVRENRKKPTVFGFNMCHQCRRNESTDDLIKCFKEGCPNYFCYSCIKKNRQKRASDFSTMNCIQSSFPKAEFLKLKDSQSFTCPQCLGQCPCSQCNVNSLFNDLREIQMGIQEDLAALEAANGGTKDQTAKSIKALSEKKFGTPTESKDGSKSCGSNSGEEEKARINMEQGKKESPNGSEKRIMQLAEVEPMKSASSNFKNDAFMNKNGGLSISSSLLSQAVAQLESGASNTFAEQTLSSCKVVLQIGAKGGLGPAIQFNKSSEDSLKPPECFSGSEPDLPGQKLMTPSSTQKRADQLAGINQNQCQPSIKAQTHLEDINTHIAAHKTLITSLEEKDQTKQVCQLANACKVILHLNSNSMATTSQTQTSGNGLEQANKQIIPTSGAQEQRNQQVQQEVSDSLQELLHQNQKRALGATIQTTEDKGLSQINKLIDGNEVQVLSTVTTNLHDSANVIHQTAALSSSTLIRFPILKSNHELTDSRLGGYQQSPQKNTSFNSCLLPPQSTESGISNALFQGSLSNLQKPTPISANSNMLLIQNSIYPSQNNIGPMIIQNQDPSKSQREGLQYLEPKLPHVANLEVQGVSADIKQDSIMQKVGQDFTRQQEQRVTIIDGSVQGGNIVNSNGISNYQDLSHSAGIQSKVISGDTENQDIISLVGEKRPSATYLSRSGTNIIPVEITSSTPREDYLLLQNLAKTDISSSMNIGFVKKIEDYQSKRLRLDVNQQTANSQQSDGTEKDSESMSEEQEEEVEEGLDDDSGSSYNEGGSKRARDTKGASKIKNVKNCLMYDQIRKQLLKVPGAQDVSEKFVKIQKQEATIHYESKKSEIYQESAYGISNTNFAPSLDQMANKNAQEAFAPQQSNLQQAVPQNEIQSVQTTSAFQPYTAVAIQKLNIQFPKIAVQQPTGSQLDPKTFQPSSIVKNIQSPQGVLETQQSSHEALGFSIPQQLNENKGGALQLIPSSALIIPQQQTTQSAFCQIQTNRPQSSLLSNNFTSNAIIQPTFIRAPSVQNPGQQVLSQPNSGVQPLLAVANKPLINAPQSSNYLGNISLLANLQTVQDLQKNPTLNNIDQASLQPIGTQQLFAQPLKADGNQDLQGRDHKLSGVSGELAEGGNLQLIDQQNQSRNIKTNAPINQQTIQGGLSQAHPQFTQIQGGRLVQTPMQQSVSSLPQVTSSGTALGAQTHPNSQIAQFIMTQNGPVQVQVQNTAHSNGVSSIPNQHQVLNNTMESGIQTSFVQVNHPMQIVNHQGQQGLKTNSLQCNGLVSTSLQTPLVQIEQAPNAYGMAQNNMPQIINLPQQQSNGPAIQQHQQIIGYTPQGQAVIGVSQNSQQIIIPQGINISQNQIFQVGPGGQLIPVSQAGQIGAQQQPQIIQASYGQQAQSSQPTQIIQQINGMSPQLQMQGGQEVVTQIGYLDPTTGQIKLLQGAGAHSVQPLIIQTCSSQGGQQQQSMRTAPSTFIQQQPSIQRQSTPFGPPIIISGLSNHQGGILDQGQFSVNQSNINSQNTQFLGNQVLLSSGQLQALQNDQLLPPSMVQQFSRQMSATQQQNGQNQFGTTGTISISQNGDQGLNMMLGAQPQKQQGLLNGMILTQGGSIVQQNFQQRQPGVMVLQNPSQKNEQSNQSSSHLPQNLQNQRILSQTNLAGLIDSNGHQIDPSNNLQLSGGFTKLGQQQQFQQQQNQQYVLTQAPSQQVSYITQQNSNFQANLPQQQQTQQPQQYFRYQQ